MSVATPINSGLFASSDPESVISAFNSTIAPNRRKQLGQCFTGKLTSRLLTALAIEKEHQKILDPMAGYGDLLDACAERLSRSNILPQLYGIEIDHELARIGRWRINRWQHKFNPKDSAYLSADAFSPDTWQAFSSAIPFDLVITNPPYVRYQALAESKLRNKPNLLDTAEIRESLLKIADRLVHPSERSVCRHLIRSYSGQADLSVPSSLLAGMAVAPGGTFALVVPQAWLNRNYAAIIRYFLLRFFEPIYFVEESGCRWIKDAQVPVTLIVARRLSTDETQIHLCNRKNTEKTIVFIEISQLALSSASIVGNAFSGNDPEFSFKEWLANGSRDDLPGIIAHHILLSHHQQRILFECGETKWIREIEPLPYRRSVKTHYPLDLVPRQIGDALPKGFIKSIQTVSDSSIQVGQGLRTGCNPFFYVDLVAEDHRKGTAKIIANELFGKQVIEVPLDVLTPVIRKQKEVCEKKIVFSEVKGRVLCLSGWLLPDDFSKLPPHLSFVGVSNYREMPCSLSELVQLAAKTRISRNGKMSLIPELSAVRTNGPIRPNMEKAVANRIKAWYMLPDFAPRHLPALFISRINHNRPAIILNSKPPILIDANFSTIWASDSLWKPSTLYAVFQSTWVQLCMEAIATPMGGGALKLEATHLKKLPIPQLFDDEIIHLTFLGDDLIQAPENTERRAQTMALTNRIILSSLHGKVLDIEKSQKITKRLVKKTDHLRSKRRPR